MVEDEKNESVDEGAEEFAEKDPQKSDAEKHRRLKQEALREAAEKEKLRGFTRSRQKHDVRGLTRKRKEKFLGGVRGRRGG